MRIDHLGVMCMATGAALGGAAGCTDTVGAGERDGVVAMYATTGSGVAALRGLAVDQATYDQLVAELGSEPKGVDLSPQAPAGTVRMLLAPGSPLVATYVAQAASPTLPALSITFDDGGPQPIGLLLPAVQKVREAAVHGDGVGEHPAGTLSITLEGAATVGGGVFVASGDVDGDVDRDAADVFVVGTHAPGASASQRAMMAGAFVAPTGLDVARFVPSGDALVMTELDVPAPYLMGRWAAAAATMNIVVDVHRAGAPVLTRFRVPRATAGSGAAPRGHVKVFDGSTGTLVRDGDAERAMFDAGYASFSSDALDQARRVLLDYANMASMSLAIAQWTGERTQALADLVVATGAGGASGYEAMACMAALPTALAVANGLDLARADNASAAATAYEAAALVPSIGLVAGGALAMQAFGAPAPSGDAELACAAVHQLASLPDSALTSEGIALRGLAQQLAMFDARHLEIELAAWVAAMDALVAAPNDPGWQAARAKADLLVDAFADAATRTQARWQLAAGLLGR